MPMPWGGEWGNGWADAPSGTFRRFLYLVPQRTNVLMPQRTITPMAQRTTNLLRTIPDWTVVEV